MTKPKKKNTPRMKDISCVWSIFCWSDNLKLLI